MSDSDVKPVGSVAGPPEQTPPKDPLDGERNNPKAVKAIQQRFDVDEATARDMWHRFIDTVAKLRERAKATGRV